MLCDRVQHADQAIEYVKLLQGGKSAVTHLVICCVTAAELRDGQELQREQQDPRGASAGPDAQPDCCPGAEE